MKLLPTNSRPLCGCEANGWPLSGSVRSARTAGWAGKEFRIEDLTQYRVAKDAGIPQPTMTQIVKGRRAVSVENALRLGLYFGTTPEFWLNLQTDYDLRLVRRAKLKAITKQVKPLPRAA